MSKNKKPKMGNVVERANLDELVTVRHCSTGKYLAACQTKVLINKDLVGGEAMPIDLALEWREREDASILTREVAHRAAMAYISLTDDTGVELEPVVEEVL